MTGESREEALRRLRERQRRAREARIDALVAEAVQRGQPTDRAYWSLVYDLELAPMTTNRAQLAELGVAVPPSASLADDALREHLWQVIRGLAELNTFLLHTDHLSDRALYERLADTILDEPVREICDGSGGREFIDLTGGSRREELPESAPFDRDRLLPRPRDG